MKDAKSYNISNLISKPTDFNLNIINKKNYKRIILDYHLLILVLTLLYGIGIGFFVGGKQIPINALKIPIIIFGLFYITLPIFCIFNLFTNNKIKLIEQIIILLSGFLIISLLLIAFAPIVVLFNITTLNVNFVVLLNTGVGILAIFCGLVYMFKIFSKLNRNGPEYLSLLLSYFIILFSAPQLIWAMRPYFHSSPGFVEPLKSNFYLEILKVAKAEPVFTIFFIFVFIVVSIIIVYNITETIEINEPGCANKEALKDRKKTRKKKITKQSNKKMGSEKTLPSQRNSIGVNSRQQTYSYPDYPRYPGYWYGPQQKGFEE